MQTQVEGKGKGPKNTSSYTRGLIRGVGCFGSSLTTVPVCGRLEYEEERGEGIRNGMMAKAVVIHRVPTNWRINGVADCVGRIIGEAIGVRWLLGERRREGKAASSVVVYLQNKVFQRRRLIKMSEKRHSVVTYRWGPKINFVIGGRVSCFGGGYFMLPEVHLRLGYVDILEVHLSLYFV